jgi:hypothetical protein
VDIYEKNQGIAMESYFGGRAETRVRAEEVPVVPVDFTSEYSSTCALLKLWEIVTARSISFYDATEHVKKLLQNITCKDCFDLRRWPNFRFFALVKPEGDILPVHTMYNGKIVNIGNNYLTASKPIWIAGPDLVASKVLTGKTPHILKALRILPDGQQSGMKSVGLRGMVNIDPYKDDLFKRVIEQRKLHRSSQEQYYWLKIFANSIYGFFVEINPEAIPLRRAVRIEVYSGEDSFTPDRRFQL